MKESVLDILIHLFENFLEAEDEPEPSREALKEELERAGYTEPEITRAIEWLEGLATDPSREVARTAVRAFRVFSSRELVRMDAEVCGYLLHLGNVGILSTTERELVIDRLLALDAEDVGIEQVKWVVLMVLFSQPGQEQAYARMESLVFAERPDALH
jgi:Smg protein